MIELQPVAYVNNVRSEIKDDQWGDVVSEIVLTDEFEEAALKGLEEFSHAEILYYFDKADLTKTGKGVRHPRGNKEWPLTGIFAQRAKDRPNHIGLCTVKLLKCQGKSLFVKGLDAIDGTPVLDIKPVMKEFLPREEVKQPPWATELMKDYWK